MHCRALAIFFTFIGASYQCSAAPQVYTSSQSRMSYESAPGDDQTYVPTLSISSIAHELATPSKLMDARTPQTLSDSPLPSASASSLLPSMMHSPSPTTSLRSQVTVANQMRPTALPLSSLRPLHIQMNAATDEQYHQPKRRGNGGRQSLIAIVFKVLGGLAGVGVLILFGRSVQSYYHTPRRDLVSDHIDRYNLERELAELEETRLCENDLPRRASFVYPAPAYQHVPKYEEAVMHAPPRVTSLPR